MRAIRAAVRRRLPTVNEVVYDYSSQVVIAYSPTDRGIDSLVSIVARPDGVQLCFTRGKHLSDPRKLLSGSGKLTRFVRVQAAEQLAHPDMQSLMNAAIAQSSVPLPCEGKGALIIRPTAASKRSVGKPES